MQPAVMRALSLSELLDTSFGVYRQLFMPLVFISVVTQAVPLAISAYVEMAGGTLTRPGTALAGLVLALVLANVGTAASTFMVAQTYLGGTLTAQEALRRSFPFLGRLIVMSLLTGLVVGVGLILLIVPGFVFICGLIVSSPAMVLEGLPGSTEAMRRSWFLTRGYKGKVFAALLVAILVIMVPVMAAGVISGVAGALVGNDALGMPLAILMVSVLQVLIYPFVYILSTLLYYDLRVRKEGYDLQVLAATMQPV